LTLSELKSCISKGFYTPLLRKRLYELTEDLPWGSEDREVVVGYIRRMESFRLGVRFATSADPRGPRQCTLEEVVPVLDRLIQVEESDKVRADAERENSWDLLAKYFWIDQICTHLDRHPTKRLGNLRFGPLFSERFCFELVGLMH
jgi:hypothetical protein